ncbi:MAG: secretion protein, partial [Clostridiales bacterium]|nr:secretion protein [Clostridiales bacterium]
PAATAPQTTKPAATAPQTTKPTATAPQTTKPTATAPSTTQNSFESQVVALVNKERAKQGLNPLTVNKKLSDVARIKSQDMHDKKYFSHNSPTYGSPFEMMKSFGISYKTAGENIAMGYTTPEKVMDGWMNSSGHRANILNASFTQIGVGYVADGHYWTQQFIG